MVGMGQPCSFWPDKGSSILHPRPDQLGESSLWLPSHSQPWPALACLARGSLSAETVPSPMLFVEEVSQAMFLESLELGNPLSIHLRVGRYDRGRYCSVVITGHRFKCTNKIKCNGPCRHCGKLVPGTQGTLNRWSL